MSDGPEFDGATYKSELDKTRLTTQLERVHAVLLDYSWHTLSSIANQTHDPEASISARLRDMRKEKFGAMQVEHQRIGNGRSGLWKYRLLRPDPVQGEFAGMTYGDHRG